MCRPLAEKTGTPQVSQVCTTATTSWCPDVRMCGLWFLVFGFRMFCCGVWCLIVVRNLRSVDTRRGRRLAGSSCGAQITPYYAPTYIPGNKVTYITVDAYRNPSFHIGNRHIFLKLPCMRLHALHGFVMLGLHSKFMPSFRQYIILHLRAHLSRRLEILP